MSKYPEALHFLYDQFYWIKNLMPGSGYKLNNKNDGKIRPFFIIGSGRSGTTLLRRILIQSEGVHIPPETYVLARLVKLFRQNRVMNWDSLVDLVLATIEYHHDFDTFHIPNLCDLSFQLKNTPRERRTLAYIIDQFYRFHANSIGEKCMIWGDKTPYNTLSINRIGKIYPNAKYLYLVRNGYDVSYSYVKNDMYDNYFDAARRWSVSNERALKFMKKNPHKVFKIKYEDFVQNPKIIGAKIFDFLELEFNERFVGAASIEHRSLGDVEKKRHHYNVYDKVSDNNIGKGKSKMSSEELRGIKRIIKPMSDLLGYDV